MRLWRGDDDDDVDDEINDDDEDDDDDDDDCDKNVSSLTNPAVSSTCCPTS